MQSRATRKAAARDAALEYGDSRCGRLTPCAAVTQLRVAPEKRLGTQRQIRSVACNSVRVIERPFGWVASNPRARKLCAQARVGARETIGRLRRC